MKGSIRKVIVIFLVFYFAFCLDLAKDAACQNVDLDNEKELKQEIHILNLINGLYLSTEQMESLIEQAKKAHNITETFMERHNQYSEDSSQTLEKLKDELIEDKGYVSKDIAREVHQSHREMLELRSDYEKQMSKIVEGVKGNLTSNQLYIIETFKPCLVPPKGPARVGQADDHVHGVKQLERIRKISDHVYSTRKYELADRIVQRLLLYKPRSTDIDEDEARDKILSIYEVARSLPDLDFEVKKEELAKELKESILPEKKGLDIDIKIERFLLNPKTVSILEEKLKSKR